MCGAPQPRSQSLQGQAGAAGPPRAPASAGRPTPSPGRRARGAGRVGHGGRVSRKPKAKRATDGAPSAAPSAVTSSLQQSGPGLGRPAAPAPAAPAAPAAAHLPRARRGQRRAGDEARQVTAQRAGQPVLRGGGKGCLGSRVRTRRPKESRAGCGRGGGEGGKGGAGEGRGGEGGRGGVRRRAARPCGRGGRGVAAARTWTLRGRSAPTPAARPMRASPPFTS
jgi:translation initiation factor IF-2